MTLAGDVRPADWQRIDRVLAVVREWEAPEYKTTPLDPLTLAKKLEALAVRYLADAKEARQAAASCRAYAAELRATGG